MKTLGDLYKEYSQSQLSPPQYSFLFGGGGGDDVDGAGVVSDDGTEFGGVLGPGIRGRRAGLRRLSSC